MGNRSVKRANQSILKVHSKLKDLSIPNKKASIVLDQWALRNFQSQGGNVGGWPPLKAGGRNTPGGGFDPTAKVLQDTGRLRNSITPFHSKTTAGIGTDVVYSKPHDQGQGRLPVRRIMPDSRKDIRLMNQLYNIYDDYVGEVTKDAQ